MTKQLTPLEALKRFRDNIRWLEENTSLRHYFENDKLHFKEDLDIIETALKDYEQLKIVAKPLTDEEKKSINSVARRLKALEIIKDIFDFDFIQIKIDNTILYNMRMTNKITNYVQNIDIKTKEQFDLLKEVLK